MRHVGIGKGQTLDRWDKVGEDLGYDGTRLGQT